MINIKLITADGRQIDYEKSDDFSIKMNRIADDLQDIEARYGEYSFSFSLPITKNNKTIFGYAGVPYVKNIFRINPIDVRLFNNDILILVGQLELQSVTEDKYNCILYSKLTQLVDDLAEKNMQEVSCPQVEWDFETTISNHINSGLTINETSYQFPLVFYNTFYCPTSVFTGLTDTIIDANGTTNHLFQRERSWQNWYYLINRTPLDENEMYVHQIPLAFYLKSMMDFMLTDIGWSMGGSFWEDENIKRIIVPFVGDTDVYDRAIYCDDGSAITGSSCAGTGATLYLDTAKFMPDMGCIEFLENVVKLFNLYMTIDVNQKTIIFETYDVMFGSKIAPYSIDNKIIGNIRITRVDENNPSILFADVANKRILGDNRYFAYSGTNAYDTVTERKYGITSNNYLFDEVFNYIGTTKEIKIGFQPPTVKRMRIRNDFDFQGANRSAGDMVMFLPFISSQLPEDNLGKAFNKKDSDTKVFNTEETIAYKGKPALFYYYGISASDFQQKTSFIGAQSNYFFFYFDDENQKIPFASPFALLSYRDNINEILQYAYENPIESANDENVMIASYMQSIYLMMASSTGVSNTTQFSLTLADNSDYGDTIYTKFHANKYKRYRESEVLEADIIITNIDWREMQINTPIKYNNQIYSLLEISSYDIVKETAKIKLIKQL